MKKVYLKYGLILAAGIVSGILISKYRMKKAASKPEGEKESSFCGCMK